MTEDNTNVEETEQAPQAEALFALLDTAIKGTESPSRVQARRDYEQRLRTFSPATYFAKPANISPIVCARFGWTNSSQDILVCNKCKAVLAISFHPQLTAANEARIAAMYQEKLCTSHSVTCLFHSNAFPKSPCPKTVIPSYLGSVLPPQIVQLVDQSDPRPLLRQRMKQLIDKVGHDRMPLDLELPTRQMMEVFPSSDGQTTTSFLSRWNRLLGGGTEDDNNNAWAAVLALFCWEPIVDAHYSVQPDQAVMLHCPTCLAQRVLCVHDKDDTETDDSSVDEARPAKKKQRCSSQQQQLNPITSHRHYCPVICGFPSEGLSTKVPLWQTIASNCVRSSEEHTREEGTMAIKGEEVMMKIHRLLQSGMR